MSDSNERFLIVIILLGIMLGFAIINKSHHKETQSQLTAYQDSVNVLIAENKKLHAAQMMYSDAIVTAVGIKPIDLVKLRQRYEYATKKATVAIERTKKFMTLQGVEHGKD